MNNSAKSSPDDLLLDYLDGKLEGTSLQSLKQQLEQSPALQTRLEELRLIHLHLSSARLESPSNDFVDRVMKNLSASSAAASALSPRNGLLLIAGILVAGGILAFMISTGTFDNANGVISLEKAQPATKYIQYTLPSLPLKGKVILDSILGISILLCLVVLDRTVLRPLFQKKTAF